MITLTFPDGAKRMVPAGTTGVDVAKSIAPSLAKRTVAMVLNGTLSDAADPITADATIKFVSRTDPEALRTLMNRYYETARSVLERHGGTVEKFVGDAVMAVFRGEDHVSRAVDASLKG